MIVLFINLDTNYWHQLLIDLFNVLMLLQMHRRFLSDIYSLVRLSNVWWANEINRSSYIYLEMMFKNDIKSKIVQFFFLFCYLLKIQQKRLKPARNRHITFFWLPSLYAHCIMRARATVSIQHLVFRCNQPCSTPACDEAEPFVRLPSV